MHNRFISYNNVQFARFEKPRSKQARKFLHILPLDLSSYVFELTSLNPQQWFWNADVYTTWKREGWLDKNDARSFNWMLEFNLGQREDLVESWYRVTHPANKAPVKLYRGAGKVNRATKVCFRELMIGHHHLAQGLWQHINQGRGRILFRQ